MNGDQAWLSSLKVGDEVAYDCSRSYSSEKRYRTSNIKKITPTGQIALENGDRFNNRGELMGVEVFIHLEPVTQSIRESMTRSNCLWVIQQTKFSTLETQHLIDIANLISRGKV